VPGFSQWVGLTAKEGRQSFEYELYTATPQVEQLEEPWSVIQGRVRKRVPQQGSVRSGQ